jgi:glycosyltransferase involved in cell wall biosynthesis
VPLRHLLISREFPPASYTPGGIGTYAENLARLLAERGETVHVIGERWSGAPLEHEIRCSGRLIVHRIRPDEAHSRLATRPDLARELRLLGRTSFPAQRFAWQAGLLAELLIETSGIDVVEAQEWEAPLYYFLLRRALGLGPARMPPCIVHLHSPTELIYRHNEWSLRRPGYLPQVRFEEYCIGAADSLLCPSRSLAAEVAARYGIPGDRIAVIPYPAGDFSFVPRTTAWRAHRLVFVGRLEARKGVVELVEAAAEVARTHPDFRIDLVGEDVRGREALSMRRYLERSIPRALRARFRFHGLQPRDRLPRLLATARAAIVPSRWENFPNSCIEAMSSGLPVIAAPTGGMTEMVEDGVTGWVARSQTPVDLAEAMRRALDTPPGVCEAMGRAAAQAIQGFCGDEVTLGRQLARRYEVVRVGVCRSDRLPAAAGPEATPDLARTRQGIGVVINALDEGSSVAALRSIELQRTRPAAVTVLNWTSDGPASATQALSRTIRWLIEEHGVAAVAVVPAFCAPMPDFLDRLQAVFARDATVGLVSGWIEDPGDGFVQPAPAFPYQWIADAVGPLFGVRAEAFLGAGGLRHQLAPVLACWDLANAVLASGWRAVSYPGLFAVAERPLGGESPAEEGRPALRALRERFPERWARDAEAVARLEAADPEQEFGLRGVLSLPIREQLTLVADALRNPRRAAGWLHSRWERFRR